MMCVNFTSLAPYIYEVHGVEKLFQYILGSKGRICKRVNDVNNVLETLNISEVAIYTSISSTMAMTILHPAEHFSACASCSNSS